MGSWLVWRAQLIISCRQMEQVDVGGVVKLLVAYDGRGIRFPEAQRLHIAYFHLEVLVDETKINLTVAEPELVAMGATEDVRVCYRRFIETPVTEKYLAVVVKLLDGEGFIVTAYFTDRVRRSRVLWRRGS